LTNITKKW